MIEIPGLKTALSFGGKVYHSKSIETYPFLLRASLRERFDLARVGLKLKYMVWRWYRYTRPRPGEAPSAQRARVEQFRARETFRDLLGRPSKRIDQIFQTAAHRASADAEQQSAGCAVALFGAVWSGKKDNTSLNMKGGSGQFGVAMQRALGDRVQLGATVRRVIGDDDGVTVTYEQGGTEQSLRARYAIVCLPATLAREVVADIPIEVDQALSLVHYGSWVGMSMITDEKGPMPYDDIYALTASDRTFDMFFNHANPLRNGTRQPGGSLMCYAGGSTAESLMSRSDEEITALYCKELYELFPQLEGHIVESRIQRWVIGGSYRRVTSDFFEPLVEYSATPEKRVRFAGDYFAPLGQMEVAVTTGQDAADLVRQDLSHRF
ncbi:MAG: amine oxidase [Actinobacteria bacterium RBG_16_67_10]|nr:MAG: amine oxidase [Actinobacteria bacterium RBG_16_67_10]